MQPVRELPAAPPAPAPRGRRRWPLLALLALAAVGVLLLVFHPRPPPRLETAAVSRGSVAVVVSATGTLTPVVTVQVGTSVSGTIQTLFVDHNSPVKKGQVIAQLDGSLLEAQVEQTHGAYLRAQGSVETARAELADATRAFERASRLARRGVLARTELEAEETRHRKAEAGVRSAEGALVHARGSWRLAQVNLGYATIRSPVDGVVIGKNVAVGQTVAASFNTPTLFTIAQDLRKMEIDASVDEADVARVHPGQAVTFTVDAFADQRFRGTVRQVRHAPVVTHNVVTYVVEVAVDNSALRFEPGMTANVEIETARRDGALVIPSAALRFRPPAGAAGSRPGAGDGASAGTVYVLGRDARLEGVAIGTGLSDGERVEITHGDLREGDRVVVRELAERTEPSKSVAPPPPGPGF